MLVGVSGTVCSGKHAVLEYLRGVGFEILNSDGSGVVEYATKNYDRDHAVLIKDRKLLDECLHRPFFLHIAVDALTLTRFERYKRKFGSIDLKEFLEGSDLDAYDFTIEASRTAHIRVHNNFSTLADLHAELDSLDIRDVSRIRPTWDAYFMQLANLAAQRSNCMKRRVGCVIVRNSRVMATGYNGTARGLRNCNMGGCPRCNAGDGSGIGLAACVCLHAEENALLEAGNDRVVGGIVYCNTCPCLTCTIKLIQSGVKEVVYSQSYYMDDQALKLFQSAGVKLRHWSN